MDGDIREYVTPILKRSTDSIHVTIVGAFYNLLVLPDTIPLMRFLGITNNSAIPSHGLMFLVSRIFCGRPLEDDRGLRLGEAAGETSFNQVLVLIEVDVEVLEHSGLAALV